MTADKLTAREQEKLNQAAGRIASYTIRAGIASVALAAAAIWFTDWRLGALAGLAFLITLLFIAVSHLFRDPKWMQQYATRLRDKDRARAEQAAYVSDLEHDLGLGEDR